MSTKAMIQKVRAEIEAHEERGWLKGYEEGLAKREQQIVEAQAALEVRNARIRELSHQKKGPTSAREALELAWELAHPVKEGQEIPEGTHVLFHPVSDDFSAHAMQFGFTVTAWDSKNLRTLDPLPEPDWLDAPAVIAVCNDTMDRAVFVRENKDGTRWVRDTRFYRWDELTDVTPLYPKEEA